MCVAKTEEQKAEAIMGILRNKLLPIPVTPGELFDRLFILRLKRIMVSDHSKREQARKEIAILEHYIWGEPYKQGRCALPFQEALDELYQCNAKLWDIENQIRALDKAVFPLNYALLSRDANYVKDVERYLNLARSVYTTNDVRSKLKADVNKACGYDVEVKEYSQHNNPEAEENP